MKREMKPRRVFLVTFMLVIGGSLWADTFSDFVGEYSVVEIDGEPALGHRLQVMERDKERGFAIAGRPGLTHVVPLSLMTPTTASKFEPREGGGIQQTYIEGDVKRTMEYFREKGLLTVRSENCTSKTCLFNEVVASETSVPGEVVPMDELFKALAGNCSIQGMDGASCKEGAIEYEFKDGVLSFQFPLQCGGTPTADYRIDGARTRVAKRPYEDVGALYRVVQAVPRFRIVEFQVGDGGVTFRDPDFEEAGRVRLRSVHCTRR